MTYAESKFQCPVLLFRGLIFDSDPWILKGTRYRP